MSQILKPSRYNIFYNIDEEDWLFNTSNLGLIPVIKVPEHTRKKKRTLEELFK